MNFNKYNGLGNDFIIIDELQKSMEFMTASQIQEICHRRTGVGADGVIYVMKSEQASLKMVIFNSDGTRAEMCGNALRCFAKHAFETGIHKETHMSVETDAGIKYISLTTENGKMRSAAVDMGIAPLGSIDKNIEGIQGVLTDKLGVGIVPYCYMTLGVPHCVLFLNGIPDSLVLEIGPALERHPYFSKGTNVNFARVVSRGCIQLKTWERGAGFTMACGTGSCATMLSAYVSDRCDKRTEVQSPGGSLIISINVENKIIMEGPAGFSFKGTWK